MLMKNESTPCIPLILSIFYALFSFSVNIIRIIFSSINFREFASSRFMPQSFGCALFAVSTATILRTRFRPTYLTFDPFDSISGVATVFLTKSSFRTLLTIPLSTLRGLTFLLAYFARFPDDLRVRNGFVYNI